MPFRLGETAGDYAILDLLGAGGMGRVFRVRSLLSDRIEAMKVLLPEATSDPALTERFLREIKVHASLDHPNIAAMRTAFRVEDHIVMIMELVPGASLSAVLQGGPVDAQRATAYARQVLAALGYAHARGVVHRDIKPSNIIVTPGGEVKVTDFGIAHRTGVERLTQAGTALGSVHYMSPEQIQGAECDARSDIYSVGVTMYEMLTGVPPFRGPNGYAVMQGHLTGQPVNPSRLVPTVPAGLSLVIGKAMAKAPEARYQSAAEMRDAMSGSETSTALLPEMVAHVESQLVRTLGPIARHLVSNASREAVSLDELCQKLASHVTDERERATFLRACAQSTTPDRPAELLEQITRKLAPFMGPMASLMVTRASRKAQTLAELYSLLAAEIPSDRDRAAFLASLGK
jgi:serine/threonine protein kinase